MGLGVERLLFVCEHLLEVANPFLRLLLVDAELVLQLKQFLLFAVELVVVFGLLIFYLALHSVAL